MSKKEQTQKPRRVSVHGETHTGRVVSARASKTVTVERLLFQYVPKYERYKKVRSRIHAHNPEDINAKEGDVVLIGESRPLSKTKSFVVLEVAKSKEESA